MPKFCVAAIALLFYSAIAWADEPPIEVVLVTGEQPGPALWKVTSGEHVLWILGEVSPVPRRMRWRSKPLERRLAESQEVLLQSGQVSEGCKQQQAATLSRPKDFSGTLKDMLSPELYSRVEAVSEIYGVRADIEKLPPLAAATHLANRVPYSLNLRVFGGSAAVSELARKADVSVTWIPVPCMPAEREGRRSEFPVSCLERIVDILADGGLGLRRLANAWSIGDIDELRQLVPAYAVANASHEPSQCQVADLGVQGANDLVVRRTESWLNEAERVLKENRSSVAVVPIAELFARDGYLAQLRAQGYEVLEPL